MAEYIEREAAIAIADYAVDEHPYDKDPKRPETYSDYNQGWTDACDYIRARLETEPAADVAPVRHGMWLNFYGDFSTAECELCSELYEVSPDESPKKEFFDAFKGFYKFCPNCGARMDGQEEPQKEDRNRT